MTERNEKIVGYVTSLRDRLRAELGPYFNDTDFSRALCTALEQRISKEIISVVSCWPSRDLVAACEAAQEIAALEAASEGASN